MKRDVRNSEESSSTLKNSKTYTDIVILTPLKNERDVARRKTELSKDPKDVWTEKQQMLQARLYVLSKKANIPKLLKSLFYRTATSNVHRCISTLSNTHSTNHSAPTRTKTQPSTRTDSGGFYILLCIYRTHSQIPEETRKMYEMHSCT